MTHWLREGVFPCLIQYTPQGKALFVDGHTSAYKDLKATLEWMIDESDLNDSLIKFEKQRNDGVMVYMKHEGALSLLREQLEHMNEQYEMKLFEWIIPRYSRLSANRRS